MTKRDRLKTTLQVLKQRLEVILPQGCPAVIGGGVVRDGIMGGQPNDIDVWLPSNINITSTQDLRVWCEDVFHSNTQVIFSGPENVEHDGEGYRDMSNHCVLEFTDLRGFKINIMRTMTVWNSEDPSAFFRGVMRNFDIDLCMFFVAFGYEAEGIHTPHVIMPRHLVADLNAGRTLIRFRWNRHRLDTMSDARRDMRTEKMNSKFHLLPHSSGTIQVSEIEPQVVTVAWLMTKIQQFPQPVIAVPAVAPRATIAVYGDSFQQGVGGQTTDGLHPSPRTMRAFYDHLAGLGITIGTNDTATTTRRVETLHDEEELDAAPLQPPIQITANPRNGMSLQELRMGTNDRGIPGVIRPEVQARLNEAFARIQETPDGHIAW